MTLWRIVSKNFGMWTFKKINMCNILNKNVL